jgi:hypothetical protein
MWRGWIFTALVSVVVSELFVGSAQAQSFQTQGTRRGAVVGGIVGGVIGARNDRPVAGIVAGSVVGGLVGREIGRQRDHQFYQQQFYQQPYARPYYQGQTWRSTTVYSDPRFQPVPTYRGPLVPQQQFYGPRQYYRPPQQPRVIRYGW